MESSTPPPTSLFQLNIDANSAYTLRSTASWAKVLGIVGLIIGILFVLAGVLAQQTLSNYRGEYGERGGFSASTLGNMGLVVYLVMGLILIISSIFAIGAGNKISRGLRANDINTLSNGFSSVRNYFAFWAIIMIICVLLMIVGIIGTVGRM